MHDMSRAEVAGVGDHSRANGRVSDSVALLLNRGATFLTDRPRDTLSELQLFVGGVYDRLDIKFSDVAFHQFQLRPFQLDRELPTIHSHTVS